MHALRGKDFEEKSPLRVRLVLLMIEQAWRPWEKSILVVEDDSVLMMISDRLTRNGYRVFAADDVSTPLLAYAGHRDEIDLLMTDIKLHFESGFDLADVLEQRYDFRHHVFFTSFFREPEVAEELVNRGKPCFEKPLEFKKRSSPFSTTCSVMHRES